MDEPSERILLELLDEGVELIVVGGMAAVLSGVPVVTFDVDIVRCRSPGKWVPSGTGGRGVGGPGTGGPGAGGAA